jgi:beta-glucosidase
MNPKNRMKLLIKMIPGFISILFCFTTFCDQKKNYRDASLPVNERVRILLHQMTLEEKLAQLISVYPRTGAQAADNVGLLNRDWAEENLKMGIGHIARPSELGGTEKVIRFTNDIQKFLVEETRLGIPAIFHEEGLHGFAADSVTVFPSATALAATWNTELVEAVFTAVAKEIRSRGGNQVLAPVLDVARDPRWGRFEETFGEDPFLVSQMGIAAVNGFQGRELPIAQGKVIATLKHFAAHGQPEGGMNVAPPGADDQTINEIHLYPFKKVVESTNVLSVMASYNEINGLPSHANPVLLNDILRENWGFKGTVVSDYGGIANLIDRHRVADSKTMAALLAIISGVDVELPDEDTYTNLLELVILGKIDEKVINGSVERILYQKFMLGLFENPYTIIYPGEIKKQLTENRRLAEEAAIQSITLLENNGVLPLKPEKYQRIIVVGPNANYTVLGGYSGKALELSSPYQGIKNLPGNRAEVSYSPGCRITKSEPNWRKDEVIPVDSLEELGLIGEAVKKARDADLVILCLGDHESVSREAWSERHLGDRPSIKLVGLQEKLFSELKKAGKPVVTFVFSNGPRDIGFLSGQSDAVFQCWYLGQETGNAVAKILFGYRNPSGRLIASFPRSEGHIPVFYNHKPSARRGYLFDEVSPLYPFGYGMGYSKLEYANAKLSKDSIRAFETTVFSVELTNHGPYKTDEVVMFFIRDELASVTRPVKELKGFQRVTLEVGESQTVSFHITPDLLTFYHPIKKSWISEPGLFTLMAGLNGPELKLTINR